MDKEARASDTYALALAADDELDRLYAVYSIGNPGPALGPRNNRLFAVNRSPGYQVFDYGFSPVELDLENAGDVDLHARTAISKEEFIVENLGVAARWPFTSAGAGALAIGKGQFESHLIIAPFSIGRNWHLDRQPDLGMETDTWFPDGKLSSMPQLQLNSGSGSIAIDSKGNLYVADLVHLGHLAWAGDLTFGFPNWEAYEANYVPQDDDYFFKRDGHPITHQNEVIDLVKFGAYGGRRHSEAEQRSHRGAVFNNAVCACNHVVDLLACDGADRIIAGDVVHHCIKILDTAGNLIQRVGVFGNAETRPEVGAPAKFDLGFHFIYNVAAEGERAFVVDRDLRRVANLKMAYRDTKQIPAPKSANELNARTGAN